MPTNLFSRFALIVIVVLLALVGLPRFPGVFTLSKLLDSSVPWSQKHNLKPGIDMAGGTSLLYEVRVPPEAQDKAKVVSDVLSILKRRVDPEGVRNLVWRPLGENRLEIQMPLTGRDENAEAAKQAYADAQEALEKTNIRISRLEAVIQNEQLSEQERKARLTELAGGSTVRQALFDQLLDLHQQRLAAQAADDFRKDAELEVKQEQLFTEVANSNLLVKTIDGIVAAKGDERTRQLNDLKTEAGDWSERLKAIDGYVAAYDAFAPLRDRLDDVAQLKRMLHGSGVLEFFIMVQPDRISPARINDLAKNGPTASDVDQTAWFEVADATKFGSPSFRYGDKQYALLSTAPNKSLRHGDGQVNWKLERAIVQNRAEGFRVERVVQFTFDSNGARAFGDLTRVNVGQPLAIVLDGKVITAPNLQSAIDQGTGTITGGGKTGFSIEEANYLANTLNAGSLPASLSDEPIMERTVGPQLGADNLRAGMLACISGLLVVGLFMFCYYYLAGLVATFAVMLNMIMILGVMAAFNATFTLAGVAGIVLTIGMAVDANVLIFERLREEQKRGLSLRQAMRNAYDKAWSSIFDANVTTGITTVVLYYFGSEEVRGFGLTLGIGIISSMFTSLYVTKTIFAFLIDKVGLQSLGSLPLTFPKWNDMLNPKVDWMKKMPLFAGISAVFIVVGMSLFVWKWSKGEMLDIEFRSGTAVSFELREPMTQGEVRQLIEAQSEKVPQALPSPTVIALGTSNREYEVASPNEKAAEVRDAVTSAMQGRLNVQERVVFAQADRAFDAVRADGVIVPIEKAVQRIGDFIPDAVADHVGGVAIMLRDMSPVVPADELVKRINQYRLSQGSDKDKAGYLKYDVETDPAHPDRAVVLVSDPQITFAASPDRWQREVAGPAWQTVVSALTSNSDMQRVTNSGPQVASETSRDAIVAIVISIIGIVFYVWIRFGDMRFGTATIVALVHDTFFVLAAVGFSHVLANTAIGDWLLLEPFRVNLTLIAAILTVLGYSMNDTVVVFDRIRENRGKLGHLDGNVINDSINQTLSRTLLTSGCTLITVFIMYLFGGVGIHGFTFALIVGILCGTYSSIAIAAPILMFRANRHPAGSARSASKLQQVGG